MFNEESVKQLKQRAKSRAVLWLVYILSVLYLNLNSDDFYNSVGLTMIGLGISMLIDERLKEGYFFKIEDLKGKKYTHEKLAVWSIIVGVLTILAGLR